MRDPAGNGGTEQVLERLWGFLGALRAEGIAGSPARREDFFRALAVSAPRDAAAFYWRARVTLVDDVRLVPAFDAVFGSWFLLREHPAPVSPAGEESSGVPAPRGTDTGVLPPAEAVLGSGAHAGADTVTSTREFGATGDSRARLLRALEAEWRRVLPSVRSRRHRPSRSRGTLALRATARLACRTGGEVVYLRHLTRPPRLRPVLLLVDVSGSVKQHTPDLLRLAHAATRAATGGAEVFTFGTRLTRVTAALAHPDTGRALTAVAHAVSDVDGGTAIGASLAEFIATPRFFSLARGAVVIVVSDGLERGDCDLMLRCTRRVALAGYRLLWWSPLACAPGYRPVTRGIAGVLPWLDRLGGVRDLPSGLAELRHVPDVCARPRREAFREWPDTNPRRQSWQS
ncbi:VWA domain-containing protein [Saccharomonospora sp. NPDC006951]